MHCNTWSICAATVLLMATSVNADLTGFTDRDEWENNAGDFSTIDFTEHPAGTVITDQYADLGVQFTDGNDFIFHTPGFVNDGAGLTTSSYFVTVEFEVPQLWFGVDHPGSAVLDAYSGDELVGTYEHIAGGVGFFSGILSEVPFDSVVIRRHGPGYPPFIDDMYWGVPAPGGVAALALAGLLGGSRRRRG